MPERAPLRPKTTSIRCIDTDRHNMTFQGVEISSGTPKAPRSRQGSRRHEVPTFLHLGPVVTTTQAKATFIPPSDHLAFDKAVSRAAGQVRRGEAELPLTLTGAASWVQLIRLGEGGHHGAHMVRQILSRF